MGPLEWRCFVVARTDPGQDRHKGLSYLLVPMDLAQKNHLRAYGHAFHTLQAGGKVMACGNGGSAAMKSLTFRGSW